MMADQSEEARARRLRTALDLADSGIALRKAQLRRKYPDESDRQISERLREWLHDRPCDAPGREIDPSTILDS